MWVAECRIPPECSYWSVQLVDYAYSALDAMYTQASLNGHSAVADPDGVFRIVVCADDPGLANWLDTGGQQRVQIRFRWYGSDAPAISSSVVSRGDLHTALTGHGSHQRGRAPDRTRQAGPSVFSGADGGDRAVDPKDVRSEIGQQHPGVVARRQTVRGRTLGPRQRLASGRCQPS